MVPWGGILDRLHCTPHYALSCNARTSECFHPSNQSEKVIYWLHDIILTVPFRPHSEQPRAMAWRIGKPQ